MASATEPQQGSRAGSSNPPPDSVDRRCRVTLLFADMSDYTTLSEHADPEEVADIRQKVMLLANAVVTKHRGEVNQFVGDGILAVFGFPEADEQDVRHALDAALELRERVLTFESSNGLPAGFRLGMHSGVHSGLVFASKGDPLHGQYQLTGDVVNTTARLCAAARRDEVLVSESALRGIEPFFETEAVEPLLLKGKSQPLPAQRVLRALNVETRFQARSKLGLTPFVGRQTELRLLEASLSDACRARGGVLCLLGDAGVGKTRVLDEFRQRAVRNGVRVFSGSCENYGGVLPLRPFMQIVRELIHVPEEAPLEQRILSVERGLENVSLELRTHLTAFLQLLSVRVWTDGGHTEERQLAVVSAVTDLLLAVASRGPVVLIIDDWQWSDGASVRVLGRLVRALKDRQLLILVAARDLAADDIVLGQVPTITLNPFTEVESLQTAQLLVAEPTGPAVLRAIYQRSGGNALFLEELCSSVKPGSGLADGLERGGVSTTVHALIRARVEQLRPELLQLLGVASVIGNEFHSWLLGRAMGVALPELEVLLEELFRTGLIQPSSSEGTLRFKHGLTREAAYEVVRMGERRRLHHQIAKALEEQHRSSGLAAHYEALAAHYAGAHEPRRASEFAELAGDKAAATSALDGAREHYSLALAQIDQLPTEDGLLRRWLTIVAKWSAACVYYPTREQLTVLMRAIGYARDLQDYSALARMEHWSGWIYYALGAQEAAIEHLVRSLEQSERAHDTKLMAQVYVNLGQCYAACGDYTPAMQHLDRGVDMKRRLGRLGFGGAYALGCRAVVHGDRGEFSAAYVHIQEALSLVKDTGAPVEGSLLGLLGMIQLWHGHWQEALQTATRGIATGERINGPYVLAMCQAVTAYARWRLERSLTSLEQLRRSVEWLERRDIHLYFSFCYGHLARAELDAGRIELACGYAWRTLDLAKRGDPLGQGTAYRVLALAAARKGNPQEAREHCARALRSADQRSSERETALTQLTLGEIELVWGQPEPADRLLADASATFERLRMDWHVGEAERVLRLR